MSPGAILAIARKQTPFEHLRAFAKAYPEAHEDFPWGESAIKVRGKVFVFMRNDDNGIGITLKLPVSRYFALDYPFTASTGYGLGKSGWVTCSFAPGEKPPLAVLEAWIDESFRAVAPKKLVGLLAKPAVG
jgi:predicted DNA-binding protein (MmcQ/YjbR family)